MPDESTRLNANDYVVHEDDDYDALSRKLSTALDEYNKLRHIVVLQSYRALFGSFKKDGPEQFRKVHAAMLLWHKVCEELKREMRAIERIDLASCIVTIIKRRYTLEEWTAVIKEAEHMQQQGKDGN